MNCLTILIVNIMSQLMPTLPYATDALEPVISRETIECHYGKHLQTYVNNLERLIKDTDMEGLSIGEIVELAPEGPVFNNAGQVLNHQLYFLQFSPKPRRNEPEGELKRRILRDFGSMELFKKRMTDAGTTLFGSGWVWLCSDREGRLEILFCHNGDNPLRHGKKPLLGFDVWEHAYYLDYQNRRADHLTRLWDIIDWEEVERRAADKSISVADSANY